MAVMAESSSREYNKYIVVLNWVHILFYFIIVLQTQRHVYYQTKKDKCKHNVVFTTRDETSDKIALSLSSRI